MAIFFDAPVQPADLTTFVREVPVPAENALTRLFGTPKRSKTNTVDFAEIVRTNRTAKYRSWDGKLHVSDRDTGSEKRVKLAPLSSSLSMGEYERLQLEFARNSGTNQAALADSIYNDAENLTNEVHNRIELAWGDALTDGKMTVNDEGFMSEADFGMPGAHAITVGTTWATIATAPALTDLISAIDIYIATNGFAPGFMLTSTRVTRLMQQNASLINAIVGAAATRSRVRTQELSDLFSSEGIPTLLPPYDKQLDVDGVSTRTIADDKLIFLPPTISDLGWTEMGVTATALELVGSSQVDFSFEEAPGIVGVVEKSGPPYRQFTFVDAAGMPILGNAKRLMVLDVIP